MRPPSQVRKRLREAERSRDSCEPHSVRAAAQ
jgi:hypothetical protein